MGVYCTIIFMFYINFSIMKRFFKGNDDTFIQLKEYLILFFVSPPGRLPKKELWKQHLYKEMHV